MKPKQEQPRVVHDSAIEPKDVALAEQAEEFGLAVLARQREDARGDDSCNLAYCKRVRKRGSHQLGARGGSRDRLNPNLLAQVHERSDFFENGEHGFEQIHSGRAADFLFGQE